MPDNEAVVRRFVDDYQTGGDERVAEAILADDFVDHSPFGPFSPDRDGVKQLFAALRAAFPDLRAEIEDQFSQGDKVVTRNVVDAMGLMQQLGALPAPA
jgi:predicted ester cyclase